MNLKDSLLVIRLSRLGHVPPGWYSTEILQEYGAPIQVLEYCQQSTGFTHIPAPFPKHRLGAPSWMKAVPSKLRPIGMWFATLLFLYKRIRAGQRPRMMIAHGLQEQLMAWVMKRLTGVPYVVHVHEVFERQELRGWNRLFFSWEGRALRDASFLLFPERERAAIYQERYRLQNRIHIVYNCPRLGMADSTAPRNLHTEYSIPDDHFIIGYMGGIGSPNALLELIEAISNVPKTSAIFWGWADDAYRIQLVDLIQSKQLQKRVLLAGQVEDKWGHLKGCDVLYSVYRDRLLRTRHQATASNKFTEALACGRAILAFERGGFGEALRETGAGLAVSDLSPTTLAEALKRLQNTQWRAKLGENGHQAHTKTYHYEVQFAPVIAHFKDLGIPFKQLKSLDNSESTAAFAG